MPRPPLVFEPFEPSGLADWLVAMRTNYIRSRIAAGDSRSEAETNADRSWERLLPGGSPAPGQRLGRVLSADRPVGYLWIGPAGTDQQRWWVWDIVINENQRGRGLGRQAMLLAEELAREGGATTLGLNVFANNVVARNLYTSLEYEETSIQMRKPL